MYSKALAGVFTILLFAVLAIAPSLGQQQFVPKTLDQHPDLAEIVSNMEQAHAEDMLRTPAYVMTRDYRFFGSDEQRAKSEVIAEINFVPPHAKTYRIDKVEGNERGKMVVQRVLNGEAAAASDHPSAAISRANYDFSLQGADVVDGRLCWILGLRPKRDEKSLIVGSAWVDQETYRVHRVEGDMAKSPSWWVKRVHTTATFEDVQGLWLQTGTRAVADVRIIGRHTLVGQVTKVETAHQVAFLPR